MSSIRFAAVSFLLVGLLTGRLEAGEPADADPGQALIALGKRVEARVAQLRGLAVLEPIRWEVTNRASVRAYLAKTLAEQYAPGELAKEGLAMTALGLVPPDLDYPTFVVGLLEEQIGGYYDPKRKTFFLADWIAPEVQETVIAHELCHALQDQHFGLDKFAQRLPGDSDGMLAHSALVEGGATLLMMLYATQAAGVEVDPNMLDLDGPMGSLMLGMSSAQFPEFSKAPRALRESLMFPYIKGLRFVAFGRREGGWKRIDACYKDLPASSEQVIHPEKYFDRRDPPTPVQLGFLDGLVPEAWELVYEDVLGEFTSALLLDAVGDRSEEKRAAAGWDGDRVRIYQRSGRLAWVGSWIFDTETDAVEFAGAMAKTAPHRHPGFTRLPLTDDPVMRFAGPDGTSLLIARDGPRVLVVDGLAADLAQAIRVAAAK